MWTKKKKKLISFSSRVYSNTIKNKKWKQRRTRSFIRKRIKKKKKIRKRLCAQCVIFSFGQCARETITRHRVSSSSILAASAAVAHIDIPFSPHAHTTLYYIPFLSLYLYLAILFSFAKKKKKIKSSIFFFSCMRE